MSCPLPWRNFKFVTDLMDRSMLALDHLSTSSTGCTDSSQQGDEMALWERKIASLNDEATEGYIFEVII